MISAACQSRCLLPRPLSYLVPCPLQAAAALSLGLAIALASSVTAQQPAGPRGGPAAQPAQVQYTPLEVPAPTQNEEKEYSNMIRSGITNNSQPLLKVLRWKIAQLTDLDNAKEFGKLRETFVRRDLLTAGRKGQEQGNTRMHEEMVQEVLKFVAEKQLTTAKYHPYTRVNVVLLIGELNQLEPGYKATDVPSPYEPALKFLVDLIEQPDQSEAVIAAALYGIDRHARFEVRSQALVARTVPVLLELAASSKDPQNNEGPGTHPWIRKRALRAVGHLGQIGQQGEVVKVLQKILGNPDETLLLRAEAARAFGFLNILRAPGVQPKQLAYQIAVLVPIAAKQQGLQNWAPQKISTFQVVLSFAEVGLKGAYGEKANQLFAPPAYWGKQPREGVGVIPACVQKDAQTKQFAGAIDSLIGRLVELFLRGQKNPNINVVGDAVAALDTFLQQNNPIAPEPKAKETDTASATTTPAVQPSVPSRAPSPQRSPVSREDLSSQREGGK